MASIWIDSVGSALEQSLEQLAAAIRACPDQLWERPMWPEPGLPAGQPFLGADWKPITDPEARGLLAQRWVERRSTPWSVAWHALECFDYDLNGEFSPWMPPPPFAGHPHWRDLPSLEAAWSREEMLGYVEHCRGLAQSVFQGMNEELGARVLPRTHRYGGQPHAQIIIGMGLHTAEHAAQIQQFASSARAT